MGFDDLCNPSLVLGLGVSPSTVEPKFSNPSPTQKLHKIQEPSLTLSLSGEITYNNHQIHTVKKVDSDDNIKARFNDNQSGDHLYRQESAASSFSNVSVKREREIGSSEEVETERVSSRVSDEYDDGSNGRKKLRLSKVQSVLLEDSFKLHSTLNPKQKQDLARELKLTPRQVEVWFQNRRARTKLKQTEIDCELLKKCCETLTDENRRLQKELQELKAMKLAQPLYMQLPAATLTMCPSCERVGGASVSAAESMGKSSFTMSPAPHFYNPFANPSAAC